MSSDRSSRHLFWFEFDLSKKSLGKAYHEIKFYKVHFLGKTINITQHISNEESTRKEQIELRIARERQQDLTDLNLASFENTNVKRESIIILQEREWILVKKNPGNKMVTRSQGKKISARETVLVTIVPGMKTYNQAIKSVKHVELKYATDAELASLEKDGKSHKR